jgi:TonB family protein
MDWMIGRGRWVVLVVAAALVGCPPGKKVAGPQNGTTGPTTPGFTGSGAAPGEPDAPRANQFGLAYLRMVHPRLKVGWRNFLDDARLRLPAGHALNNTSLSATLAIVVDPKGKLVEVRASRSSGDADFDAAALEIVRDAAPYPLAGREFVGDDGLVRLSWLFARDRRQAGIATASVVPARWGVDRAVPKFISEGDLTTAAIRLGGAAADPKQDAAVLGLGP